MANRLIAPLALLLAGLALALAAIALPAPARAEPADIAAAARGVVRVVVLGHDGDQIFPISHGTGFVVDGGIIVTNAHVVSEVLELPGLTLGIVPPEGGAAVAGRLLSYSPKNDLALIRTERPLHLPPLAIVPTPPGDSAMVSAVGYPMNVDRAQGLSIADVLRPQPPVKSRGFISGERPSREFDTILHTAPIARGNSGGPLLDNCGRVVGINSFGTESQGTDSDFYFAVSARELLPFLRANGVTPQVNGLPCRSMAELNAEEEDAARNKAQAAMDVARRQEAQAAQRRAEATRQAERAVIEERDNGLALAALFWALALAAGAYAWLAKEKGDRQRARIAAGIAAATLAATLFAWFGRPGMDAIDERTIAALRNNAPAAQAPPAVPQATGEGPMICTVDLARSRVTSSGTDDVPIRWRADGCINTRTQYGLSGGEWSRVLVPNDEEAVSVNSYDPQTREYRVERYLLGLDAIAAARKARSEYTAPQCGGGEPAAQELGAKQGAIHSMLPAQPNERLVYRCHAVSEQEFAQATTQANLP